MKKETLGFKIEERSGVKVIVEDKGGVRPATDHEIAMWDLIEKHEEKFDFFRKILRERDEQANVNTDKWIEETKILLDKLEAAQAQK